MLPTKSYHVIQIRFQMWSCDQSFSNSTISIREVIKTYFISFLLSKQFYKDLTRRNNFFRGALGSSSTIWKQCKAWSRNFAQVRQRVETKSQKVFEANSYVCRNQELERGLLTPPTPTPTPSPVPRPSTSRVNK